MRILAFSSGPMRSSALTLLGSATLPLWFVANGVAMTVTLRYPPTQGSGQHVAVLQQQWIHAEIRALLVARGRPGAGGLHQPASSGPLRMHRFTTWGDPVQRWARVSDLLGGRGMASDNLPAIRVQAAPAAARPAPPTFAATAEEETGLDWHRIASALWRFNWLLLLSAVLGIGAGVAARRVLRPAYVAQATVWIDVPDRRDGPDRGPIRPGGLFSAEAWVDLLRSYFVLDHVVRDLGLYLELKSPDDTARFAGFGVAESFRPGDYRLSVDPAGRAYVLSTIKGIVLER